MGSSLFSELFRYSSADFLKSLPIGLRLLWNQLLGRVSRAVIDSPFLLGCACIALFELREYYEWSVLLSSVQVNSDRSELAAGSIERLETLLERTDPTSAAPLRCYSAKSFRCYLAEHGDDPASLSWEHYYACLVAGYGLSHELNIELTQKSLLLRIADRLVRAEGLAPPPSLDPVELELKFGVSLHPHDLPNPRVAYGVCKLQATFAPLPVRVARHTTLLLLDGARLALGYSRHWVPIPEGWVSFLVRASKVGDEALRSRPPLLFFHGIGMGALPHLSFFEHFCRDRTLILVELPNHGHWHYQCQNASPSSLRTAVRELFQRLGPSIVPQEKVPGGVSSRKFIFDAMGHSLGTDFLSMTFCSQRSRDISPRRIVLLDPICFPHQILWAHRAPFWDFNDIRARMSALWAPVAWCVLHFCIRDIYTQQACVRTLTSDVILLEAGAPTFVAFGGKDEVVPSVDLHDYVRSHHPDFTIFYEPEADHGAFLKALPGDARVTRLVKAVQRFLGPPTPPLNNSDYCA